MSVTNLAIRALTRPRSNSVTISSNMFFLAYLATIPLRLSPVMQAPIGGISALRLSNVILIIPLLVLLFERRLWRQSDKIERASALAFIAYSVLFAVDFVRSLGNFDLFHLLSPNLFSEDRGAYVNYFLLVPLMTVSAFLYVLKRVRTETAILDVFAALGFGIFALSVTLLFACLLNPELVVTSYRSGMGILCLTYFGMHYTAIGTMYVMSAPILLYLALRRGGFWIAIYFIALVAVVLVQARTAWVCFFIASAAVLIVMGRTRLLLATAPIVLLAIVYIAGSIVSGLVGLGVSDSSTFDLQLFLSGRNDFIWMPLLKEWFADPQKFYFGAGLSGILSSQSMRAGVILHVGEAHNMFLEMFLDNGLVGLIALVAAIALWLRWSLRQGRKLESKIYWVLLICVVSFLLSSLTGRHFLPTAENVMMYPIMGALVSVALLHRQGPATGRVARGFRRPRRAALTAQAAK